jgi:hypothetical protein
LDKIVTHHSTRYHQRLPPCHRTQFLHIRRRLHTPPPPATPRPADHLPGTPSLYPTDWSHPNRAPPGESLVLFPPWRAAARQRMLVRRREHWASPAEEQGVQDDGGAPCSGWWSPGRLRAGQMSPASDPPMAAATAGWSWWGTESWLPPRTRGATSRIRPRAGQMFSTPTLASEGRNLSLSNIWVLNIAISQVLCKSLMHVVSEKND